MKNRAKHNKVFKDAIIQNNTPLSQAERFPVFFDALVSTANIANVQLYFRNGILTTTINGLKISETKWPFRDAAVTTVNRPNRHIVRIQSRPTHKRSWEICSKIIRSCLKIRRFFSKEVRRKGSQRRRVPQFLNTCPVTIFFFDLFSYIIFTKQFTGGPIFQTWTQILPLSNKC